MLERVQVMILLVLLVSLWCKNPEKISYWFLKLPETTFHLN
jgi:hypothetical protein